jgi:fido (protein-threonine AMPylation protein)
MSGDILYNVRDWQRVQRLGIHPTVISPESYAARVLAGMRLGQATLAETKDTVPSISTIKGLHYIMFEGVHPWAGTFRQPGHEVSAGKLDCSLAVDVPRDLMKLRKEMLDNPLSGSREYKAEVLAFYHASFLAIHPFADGNGRVAREILDFQTRRLLGHSISQRVERGEYIEALSVAQGTGQLKPLAKIISRNDLKVSRSLVSSGEHGRPQGHDDSLLVSRPVMVDEMAFSGLRRR